MSSSRRERIRKAGRLRFVLLYGVCGWGLLFALAFIVPFGLPGILLLCWLSGHFEAPSILGCVVLPMLLGAIGGFGWGSRAWKDRFEAPSHPNV